MTQDRKASKNTKQTRTSAPRRGTRLARGTSRPWQKNQIPESEIVLLAVTGMSPAVLTETIWALAHPAADSGDEPVIPTASSC